MFYRTDVEWKSVEDSTGLPDTGLVYVKYPNLLQFYTFPRMDVKDFSLFSDRGVVMWAIIPSGDEPNLNPMPE